MLIYFRLVWILILIYWYMLIYFGLVWILILIYWYMLIYFGLVWILVYWYTLVYVGFDVHKKQARDSFICKVGRFEKYMMSGENDELTKIDANGKLIIEISEDAELNIIHDPILKMQ